MNSAIHAEIGALAETYRGDIPKGFVAEVDRVEAVFSAGQGLELAREKATGAEVKSNRDICEVVLGELHALFCTKDPRYERVRQHGGEVSTGVVTAVAEVVARQVGLGIPGATACVALVVLMCIRVGIEVFCRRLTGENVGMDE